MNTTTVKTTIYQLGFNSSIPIYAFFVNPLIVIRLYQIGYSFTFLFGNIASLLTFSRPTLRKISTDCFFIILDIFNHPRLRKRALASTGQANNHHQGNVQSQMFILMLASICIFLITTVPLGMYKIISSQGKLIREAAINTTIWTGLG